MNSQGITLSASMRTNLFSLQTTDNLLFRTQERLATGKKVNSALDNARSFFAASANINKANALTDRKDAMGQAIQTIKAANAGIEGLLDLAEQMKALVTKLKGSPIVSELRYNTIPELETLYAQYKSLASDASYQGTNLLQSGSELTVDFNEDASSTLSVSGIYTPIYIFSNELSDYAQYLWLTETDDAIINSIDAMIEDLGSASTRFSNNLEIINARLDFTNNTINLLNEGADKLTLADMNEEGANFLSLQTRQDLSITSLNLASQSQRSVLSLFN